MSWMIDAFWKSWRRDTDREVQEKRERVHEVLNEVQSDVLAARSKLEHENSRHSQSLEAAKKELDAVADRIAKVIGGK